MLGDRRTIGRIPCQIVFVEDGPGVVILDCVATELARIGDQILERGTPFSIEAALPEAAWIRGAKTVLDRWGSEGSTVKFEFRQRRDRAQLLASDGMNRMLLDLQPGDAAA